MKNKFIILYILLLVLCISIYLFTINNHSFYKKDIAKIIKIEERYDTTREVTYGYKDNYYIQKLTLEVLNNKYKGEKVIVENEYDDGLAYYEKYKIGETVFVDINTTTNNELQISIEGIKRDKYFVLITIIFILVIVLVGRLKGFLSIIGLMINISIFITSISLNVTGRGLLIALIISSVIFCITGLILSSGINKCTLSSIISSLLGTLTTILIAWIVLWSTKGNEIRFDQIELLTRPYESVFISSLLIGSLGAIMDISVTITSSFKELILIFKDIKGFKFAKGEKFDKKALVLVMMSTIIECKKNIVVDSNKTKKDNLNMVNTFDEAIAFVKDYNNEQIIKLIYSQPRFTGIIMDGLIEMYYKNVKADVKLVESSNEQYENDQLRASRNLAIIDEVLFKTREQGTKGSVGFPQKEYNDDQMEIILTNLVKGNNNYITDKTLKAKISSISKEEIFAEVLKNAHRLNCLCNDEKDLLEASQYGMPPTHFATIRMLLHELNQTPIDNSNITSLIENIDKNTLTFLNKSFILNTVLHNDNLPLSNL